MVLAILLDLNDLLRAVIASLVAAVAFITAVSAAILGGSKFVDFGTDGKTVAAFGSLALTLLASLVALLIIAAGLYLMVTG